VNHQSNLSLDNTNHNNINISIPLCSICNNKFKTVSDAESGEIICSICVIVLSEEKELPLHPRVQEEMTVMNHANSKSTNTDLRYYENNSYNNNNILFNIESSTNIGRSNVDAIGKKISKDMENKIEKLRIWERRTRYINPKDRNVKSAFTQLNSIKHKLGLSNAIVEKSFYI
jgi:transcription initiation factor TFIIB